MRYDTVLSERSAMLPHDSREDSRRGRRGFALPAVLIMLVVAMLSCGAFLSVAFHEYNLAVQEERHAQALFLAEAGIQRTLNLADNVSDLSSLPAHPYTDEPLGPGTYSVDVPSATSGRATIVATGQVSERSRSIRLQISQD